MRREFKGESTGCSRLRQQPTGDTKVSRGIRDERACLEYMERQLQEQEGPKGENKVAALKEKD